MEESFPPARILGIETSCDETAAAVVEDGRIILSNVVASQVDLHSQFGGIFPEVASREHIRKIHLVITEALQDAHLEITDVDAIAVTRGPGLPGSLVVGINAAKGLVLGSDLPMIGVNHLEGHLYSAWLHQPEIEPPDPPEFPLLALIVSGGHTELVLMENHLTYKRLGGTLDDAAGEAFDKVARLLELGYPGGPAIQTASEYGNPIAYDFPRAWLDNSSSFSFSGLKTAVMRTVRRIEGEDKSLPANDLAASFQAAVVEVLVVKTIQAAKKHKAKGILVAGGVSANAALRSAINQRSSCPVHIPPIELCTDNAAMIAAAGYHRFNRGETAEMDMDALPTWPLSEL